MFQKIKGLVKGTSNKMAATYLKVKEYLKQKSEELANWLVRPKLSRANAGAAFVDTLIVIIIIIVIGAILLTFLQTMFNVNILPKVRDKIVAMFG